MPIKDDWVNGQTIDASDINAWSAAINDLEENGGASSWNDLADKPAVIAAGVSQAAARTEISVMSSAEVTSAITAAVNALLNGAPGALDTLKELADAINDDASYAATVTAALAGKQPLDADLTAIAALTSAANKVPYATGSGAWALTDFTAAGRALVDDADSAAQRATLGAAKRTSYLVDDYGTVDYTGTTAADTAVAAAITAMGTSAGILEFGVGTVKLNSTKTLAYPGQGIRGQGSGATTIDYRGTGDCFRVYDSTVNHAGTVAPLDAGPITGLYIVGSNNANTSIVGLHIGDLSRVHIEDVQILGFNNTTSKGFWGDNLYTWCERAYVRMSVEDCTDCFVFDGPGGATRVSWDYSQFFLSANPTANQNGVVVKNNTDMIGVSMQIVGNAGSNNGPNTGTFFTVGVGASDISRFQGELNIAVESSDSPLVSPTDINVGPDASIVASYGSLRFLGSGFQAGSATWTNTDFTGYVYAPALNSVHNSDAFFAHNPHIVGDIQGRNGTVMLAIGESASAVNYLGVVNRASGSPPYFQTLGSNTNVGMGFVTKGTGTYDFYTSSGTVTTLRTIGQDANMNLDLVTPGTGVVKANGNPVGVKVTVPSTATSTGILGQWAADSSFLYICTAANTWRRVAIASW